MKNIKLQLPAAFCALSEDERIYIEGGTAAGDVWNVLTATVTGLASAAGEAFSLVASGEMSLFAALSSGFVYLAGNVVASIIWMIA